MDFICAVPHPVAEELVAKIHDLYTCAKPLECTRSVCFPDEHWTDVTTDYYDEHTGHLRSSPISDGSS